MRSITRLFGAVGALADSVLALAHVVDAIAGRLRQAVALETDPPALGHGAEVIDAEGDGGAPARRRKAASAS